MRGYRAAMAAYARFEGRASRSEFWLFNAVVLLVIGLAYVLVWPRFHAGRGPISFWSHQIFLLLFSFFHIVPAAGVLVRRLHDVGLSGTWALAALFPPAALLLLIPACLPGTVGPNRYGPDPLEPNPLADLAALAPKYRSPLARVEPSFGVPAQAVPRGSLIGELERLARLRESGTLSDTEFAVMKARLLSRRGTA